MSKYIKKADVILIIAIVIITATAFILFTNVNYAEIGSGTEGKKVQIIADRKIVGEYSFTEKELININKKHEIIPIEDCEFQNSYNIVKVSKNAVKMSFAECPDHRCIKQGKISEVGQVIVCLPNKLIIKIVGVEEENNTDSVAY
ncbi:MAG: NusG domain II-containing protein [Anaerovoracaceae bacterium]